MKNSFAALMYRMKYIDRWQLMRTSRSESLAEHSLDVAVLAHLLAHLGVSRFGRRWNPDRAAVLALYHDAPEIITGDLPTPIKHGYPAIEQAYEQVEAGAIDTLVACLPTDIAPAFAAILGATTCDSCTEDQDLRKLVHAADKLSALLKCLEELGMGNQEFADAKQALELKLEELAQEVPEVRVFIEECLPAFGATLDTLITNTTLPLPSEESHARSHA